MLSFWELYKSVVKQYLLLMSSAASLGAMLGIYLAYQITH